MRHYAREFSELVNSTGEYELLSEYKGVRLYVTMKHLTCGHVWKVKPGDFKSKGSRCPICAYKNKVNPRSVKAKKEFNELVSSLDDYELLSEYRISKEHVMMKHLTCGTVWRVTPYAFKNQNTRCPKCANSGTSKLEEIVSKGLKEMGIPYLREYRFSDCKDKNPLPFDFVLLDKEGNIFMVLEVDGVQHDKPLEVFGGEEEYKERKKHDKIKEAFCKKNGIQFKRIKSKELKIKN